MLQCDRPWPPPPCILSRLSISEGGSLRPSSRGWELLRVVRRRHGGVGLQIHHVFQFRFRRVSRQAWFGPDYRLIKNIWPAFSAEKAFTVGKRAPVVDENW